MGSMQKWTAINIQAWCRGLMGLTLFSESYWQLVAHEGRCINPFSGIAISELLTVQ